MSKMIAYEYMTLRLTQETCRKLKEWYNQTTKAKGFHDWAAGILEEICQLPLPEDFEEEADV